MGHLRTCEGTTFVLYICTNDVLKKVIGYYLEDEDFER